MTATQSVDQFVVIAGSLSSGGRDIRDTVRILDVDRIRSRVARVLTEVPAFR